MSDDRKDAAESPSRLPEVLEFLEREDVRRLFRVAAFSPSSPKVLANVPLPAGLSLNATVDLVAAVNRLHAIYSPVPDAVGRTYWHVDSPDLRRALSDIDRQCSTGSALDRAVRERSGTRFLIGSDIAETIATAHLDGMTIDEVETRELLALQRRPQRAGEKVVANHFKLMSYLEEIANENWTPALLMELHARLTEGVPEVKAKSGPFAVDQEAKTALLQTLSDYYMEGGWMGPQHPVSTAIQVRGQVILLQPFPSWNGMMSRILFRLYALRSGYPILGRLAVSHSELLWERGELPGFEAPETADPEARTLSLFSYMEQYNEGDFTEWLTLQVRFISHALADLRRRMEHAGVEDEDMLLRMREDPSLNHRQRTMLRRAIRLPEAEFRIGYHRTAHGVAYATAHQDFEELAEKGYLIRTQRGRAFVFLPAPDLPKKLGMEQDPPDDGEG